MILFSGCGTGNLAVFLGEQLGHTDAIVHCLDFSKTSLDIAKRRTAIRQLTNVRFHHERLEDIPNLGLGKFDLIDSSGVLHHLRYIPNLSCDEGKFYSISMACSHPNIKCMLSRQC